VTDDIRSELAHLRAIADALGGVVWEFDWNTGAFTYVSAAAERMLSYTRAEWLEPGFWLERVHAEDRERAVEYCQSSTKRGENHTFEYRMVNRDETVVWVRDIVTVDPERRMDGPLRGMLLDITAEKAAQEERQASERIARRTADQFDAVFRLTHDLFFRLDPEGRVVDFRAPAPEVLYEAPGRFLGRPLADVLPPVVAPMLRDLVDQARQTGELAVAEYPLPGNERLFDWEARVLPLAEGETAVVCRDITERVRRQRALGQSQQLYRSLVELSPYAVYVIGLDLHVRFANEAAARMFRARGANQLLGMSVSDMIPHGHEESDAVSEARELVRRLKAGAEYGELDTLDHRSRSLTLDGGVIDIERSMAGITFAGEPALLVIARDITEELAAERALHESEARLRNVVEQAPLGMHLYAMRDGELWLTEANPAADRILGIVHAEILGHSAPAALPEFFRRGAGDVCKTIANEGGSWRGRFEYTAEQADRVFEATVFQVEPGAVAMLFAEVAESS